MAKSSVTIFCLLFFTCIFSGLITVEGWWSQDLPINTSDSSESEKELDGRFKSEITYPVCGVYILHSPYHTKKKCIINIYLKLLDVLHNVLEKPQNKRMSNWDRKPSRLSVFSAGDLCSVKRGPRFGQLCDCPRTSKCSYFFLKCL